MASAIAAPTFAYDVVRHGGGLTPAVVVSLVVLLLTALGARWMLRTHPTVDRALTTGFYAWSVASVGVLTTVVLSAGGDPRRYGVLFGLLVVMLATIYPPRGQALLIGLAVGAYALTLRALPAGDIVVQLVFVGLMAGLAVVLAHQERAVRHDERDARRSAERRAEMIATIAAMTTLEPEEVFSAVVDGVVDLGFELAHLGVVRDGWLEPVRYAGFAEEELPEPIPATAGIAGQAMKQRRAVVVHDYHRFRHRVPDRPSVGSAIAVPVVIDGEPAGALIGARRTPGGFDPALVEIIEVLGAQAGRSLALSRLYEKERDTVARLIELDGMKNDFVSNVSHELRTPLTVLRGMGDTVVRRWDQLGEDGVRQLVDRMNANSQRLHEMITALLDFSRFQAGKVDVHPESVELCSAVASVLMRLEPMFEGYVVSSTVHELHVLVDPVLLDHVLENLLGNAVRHTPRGTCVIVTTRVEDAFVRLTVADDGPGIPAEALPRLTERFYRGGDTNLRPSGGLGLGLSLCRQILEAHGTALDVTSTEGSGTAFSFALPLVLPGTGAQPSQARSGSAVSSG